MCNRYTMLWLDKNTQICSFNITYQGACIPFIL